MDAKAWVNLGSTDVGTRPAVPVVAGQPIQAASSNLNPNPDPHAISKLEEEVERLKKEKDDNAQKLQVASHGIELKRK